MCAGSSQILLPFTCHLATGRENSAPSTLRCPHPLCCAPGGPSGHVLIQAGKNSRPLRSGVSGGEALSILGVEVRGIGLHPAACSDALSHKGAVSLSSVLVGLSPPGRIRFSGVSESPVCGSQGDRDGSPSVPPPTAPWGPGPAIHTLFCSVGGKATYPPGYLRAA